MGNAKKLFEMNAVLKLAGNANESLLPLLSGMEDIRIDCLTDKNDKLVGKNISGLPVKSVFE